MSFQECSSSKFSSIHSFIHPNDPEWRSSKPREDDRRLSSNSTHRQDRHGPRRMSTTYSSNADVDAGPQDSHTRRHSTPLVSQADLFLQCKVEVDPEESLYDETSRVETMHRGSRRDGDKDLHKNSKTRAGERGRSNNLSTSRTRAYDASRKYPVRERSRDSPRFHRASSTASKVCRFFFNPFYWVKS